MTKCIDDATERSLVAIDEFGKGTQAKSGLALLAGTCIHWLKKPQIAHTIVVTHFHSLYEQLPPRHPQLHFQNFRVEVRANGAEIFAGLFRLGFSYVFSFIRFIRMFQTSIASATCSHSLTATLNQAWLPLLRRNVDSTEP